MHLILELSYTNSLKTKLGLIRERKNPPDKRVAFLPIQCSELQYQYPGLQFIVEACGTRCVPDEQFAALGIPVHSSIEDCDVLFGIKEVPVEYLIPGKTYFFFSHTIKKQNHNRVLLREILRKKITLVDYECLQDEMGHRTVAFGRFAGIVGAYNAFRMWMLRFHYIHLKAAGECGDMAEMLDYAQHHLLGIGPVKIAVTGRGRVGNGAIEVMKKLGIREIQPQEYLDFEFSEPVFTVLSSRHYYQHPTKASWDENHFRKAPGEYSSDFLPFAFQSDILIPCHYWDPAAPKLFELKDLLHPDWKIKVISDVTCDLDGSVPTTIRTSSIADPFFDFDPEKSIEMPPFSGNKHITICAVDNLPCELPYDASQAFGEMLGQHVIPELASDNQMNIEKATIAKDGRLTDRFMYLSDYVADEMPVEN